MIRDRTRWWISLGLFLMLSAPLTADAFNDRHLKRAKETGHCKRCDLSQIDFSGSVMVDSDLSRARFHSANLRGVYFRGVKLYKADLTAADLSDAYLVESEFSSAKLIDAILAGSNLTDSLLHKADLSGASLKNANLTRTVLTGADLKFVTQLKQMETALSVTCRNQIFDI